MKAKFFLFLCSLVFVFSTFPMLDGGLRVTWNYLRGDDHYAWILKVPQLTNCFTQECQFVKDTKEQLYINFKEFDYDLNYKRWREQHCLHDVYTLLYTVQMYSYTKLFNLPNIESAYEYAAYTGYALSVISIISFLVVTFGYTAAALTLFLLSFSKWIIPQYGIITPSFFITGISFGFLTLYIKNHRLFFKLLPIIIVFISLYHSIGKLYSAAFIALSFVHIYKFYKKDSKIIKLWVLSVLSLAAMAALGFIENPQFKLIPFPFHDFSEKLTHFKANIGELVKLLSTQLYMGPLPTDLIFLISLYMFYYLFKKSRKAGKLNYEQSAVCVFYFLLLISSILHLFKNHPGELSSRLIIPFTVVLTGLISFTALKIIPTQESAKKIKLALTCICLLFSASYIKYFLEGHTHFETHPKWQFNSAADNFYSPAQVNKIYKPDGSCGTILYFDQTPMWVYSTYGALNCGAIVGYVWPNGHAKLQELIANKDVTMAVGFNPIFTSTNIPLLHKNHAVQIKFKQQPKANLNLKFKTHLIGAKVLITTADTLGKPTSHQELTLNAGEIKTVQIPIETANTLQITVPDGISQLLQASFKENLNWPWNEDILFQFISVNDQGNATGVQSVNLKEWQTAVENYFKIKVEAYDDEKSTVLLKVIDKI